MTKSEKISRFLEDANEKVIVDIYNQYASLNYYALIFSMYEFDEMMSHKSPSDIAWAIHGGDFSPINDYFWFDDNGNVYSCDYPSTDCDLISESELIDYMIVNDESFGYHEIREILGEEEDEV